MISSSEINDINNTDNSEKHHFVSVQKVDNKSISSGFSKLSKFVQDEQKKNAIDFDHQRSVCTDLTEWYFSPLTWLDTAFVRLTYGDLVFYKKPVIKKLKNERNWEKFFLDFGIDLKSKNVFL